MSIQSRRQALQDAGLAHVLSIADVGTKAQITWQWEPSSAEKAVANGLESGCTHIWFQARPSRLTGQGDAPYNISLSGLTFDHSTAVEGDTVGALTVSDDDSGETYVYSILSDASVGMVKIIPGEAILKVGATSLVAATYAVVIKVIDSHGNVFHKAFSIIIS